MSDLSTDPYKGVRDFYPEDKRRQNYLFSVMREAAERFGYQEIDGSVLEPADLYDAKSGNELAQEQSYRFEDRGGREVMLRPEMTPTTARMIAARHKSMSFPIRWFSMPNLFRYERPQHGRLREHWQLNADIFGTAGPLAEAEIISLAYQTLRSFGAEKKDFVIKISSRGLFQQFCNSQLSVSDNEYRQLTRLVDKRDKMNADNFDAALADQLSADQKQRLKSYLEIESLEKLPSQFTDEPPEMKRLNAVFQMLDKRDITNAKFAPDLVRGLDYYTGTVFEVFDTNQDNPRSICGGGRYDNLMEIFGEESIPAVGFGLGDVTLADFLETHKLWPNLSASLDVKIILVERKSHADFAHQVADTLRSNGISVAVDISGSSVSTQLEQADKSDAKHAIVIGDDEIQNNKVTIKNLASGDEQVIEYNKLDSFWE